ncbi:serine/threonine-protein kinase 32C-like isoform X2 [Daphnia pulicaria]|uniref:serine/threonine-protein kinase 32C-like isoform X2 n=1 Tax=Daphnia pulicaria TaxID=35523 RepID=UPI001EEB6300|nr:serine/threonine-protein kinase 32C-like isoform X2 [Daphnia pulicaria]
MEDKVDLIWNDTEKLQNWLESLDEKKFLDEDFNDFKDIFLEWETQDSAIRKALKTPQLLSEYIWHTATESEGNYKPKSIKLKKKLGEGKCWTVFECEYITDGSVYLTACKKCKPGSDEDFNVEIKTLRKLSHLFVVKYLDVVTMNSEKFIVMELCEGSLKDYAEGNLKEIPKDSLDEKILLSQVALGLAFIHDKGIIHKDLKLDNILLKRQSNRLVLAKIADFGFAKELKLGKSEFSQTKHAGTENYMSPELLKAKNGVYPASFASDVYALGIIIAQIALKGEHPFSAHDSWRIISMIEGLTPQNLHGLRSELIDLIRKLTDKDPKKRPAMVLVLHHPYFVLTNDRTIKRFVNQFWDGLKLILPRGDHTKRVMPILYEKILSNQNFQEWYDSVYDEMPITEKEKEEMGNTLRMFKNLKPDITCDDLYPDKEYVNIIKEGISSEYDGIKNYVKEITSLYPSGLSRYRLYKLVKRAPTFLVPYFSSQLLDLFPIINTQAHNNPLLKTSSQRNKDPESSKSSVKQHRLEIVSELEWSSTYYDDDEELIDDVSKGGKTLPSL